jgi:hypothetical protein
MAEALAASKTRDFWKEIRKTQKTIKTIPSTVDDASTKQDIAYLFHGKFKDLYNSRKLNEDDINGISLELEKRIYMAVLA